MLVDLHFNELPGLRCGAQCATAMVSGRARDGFAIGADLDQCAKGNGGLGLYQGAVPFYRVPGMDTLLQHQPQLPQIGNGGGDVRSQADAILKGR